MFCLEMLVIESALLFFMCVELLKMSKYILGRQYTKVIPSQLGTQYKVMAGVADETGHPLVQHDTQENKLLQQLIHSMLVKDAGKRNENEMGTVQEIHELHERDNLRMQMRRCVSFKEIRDYQDCVDPLQQLLEESESDNEYDRQFNFISEPNSPRSKEMLINPNFHRRMGELSRAYCMRDQYDNCYHEGQPLFMFDFKNTTLVERTVQTNVLELLGVDDLLPRDSNMLNQIRNPGDPTEKHAENSVHEDNDLVDTAQQLGSDLVTRVLNQFEGFQEMKKRKRLAPARLRALPHFEIGDIIGQFDIDEDGHYIIVSNGVDERGKLVLEDAKGNRVNRRGYLLNNLGHVITNKGIVIFKSDELDSDEEIPAPFCYQKHKEQLGLHSDAPPHLFGIVAEQDEEEELVDKEYRKIRKAGQTKTGEADDAPSSILNSKRKQQRQELYRQSDEDFYERIARPIKPLGRDRLLMPNAAQVHALRHPQLLERPMNEDLEYDGEQEADDTPIDEWDEPETQSKADNQPLLPNRH